MGGLSVLGKLLDGTLTAQGVREHIDDALGGDGALGLAADGADLAQSAGVKLASTCTAEANLLRAAGTPVLAAGLQILLAYTLLTGWPAEPDVGGKFVEGAEQFGAVGDGLGAARPSGSWTGTASDAYRARSDEQHARAQRMKAADQRLSGILEVEAQAVTQTREVLDRCSTALGIAIVPALLLLATGPEGILLSEAFQIAAVATAVPIATQAMATLGAAAAANAGRIEQVAAEYGQIAATVKPLGAVVAPTAAGAAPAAPATPATTSATPATAATPTAPVAGPATAAPSAPAAPSGAGAGAGAGAGGAAAGGGAPGSAAAPAAGTETAGGGAAAGGVAGSAPAGSAAPSSGGIPSLPGGASPGGTGSGLLGAVAGPAAQALGQLGQGAQAGAAPQPGAASGVPGAPGQVPGVRPAVSQPPDEATPEQATPEQATPEQATPEQAGSGAAGAGGPRAPIHMEIELDPEQLSEPVHLTLDPKNTEDA